MEAAPGAEALQLWDFGPKLDQVQDLVMRQQARLEAFAEQYTLLADEVHVLRECLEDAGAVQAETFLARQHRKRFARTCARHPCSWSVQLEAVAATHERIFALAELVGRCGMAVFAATSRLLWRAASAAAPELAAALPPAVYALGGEDDDGQALADVERFCPDAGVWEPSVPLSTPRKWCAAASVAGHVYVVGGWGVDDDTLDRVDRFDPWLNTWEVMPSMARRRGAVAATSLGASIWAVGGQDGQLVHDTAELFNLGTGVWTLLAPMRNPRHAAGAVELQGHVCAIGGQGVLGEALGVVEYYDGQTSAWLEMPPLRTPRAGLAAATMAGCAYAVGGCDAAGHELCSLERFDPRVGAWEPLAALVVPRWGLGAAACVGRLYALGGTEGADGASIGACEKYFEEEPAGTAGVQAASIGNWAFVGCLRLPRRLFGAVATR